MPRRLPAEPGTAPGLSHGARGGRWPEALRFRARTKVVGRPLIAVAAMLVSTAPVTGQALDHVTVAVADLAEAGRFFTALGFHLKPGREHPNSIENLHAKFADGTELELLTASEPRDALAREYLTRIAAGEGGAFVALRHPDVQDLAAHIAEYGRNAEATTSIGMRALTFPPTHALRPVWFIEMAEPAVDLPEITSHENGAMRLAAVWLAGTAGEALPGLARDLGLDVRETSWPRPGSVGIRLVSGWLYAIGGSEGRASTVAGATIEVPDIERAARIVERAGVPFIRRQDARGGGLLISPGSAHGIWLELLQMVPSGGEASR